MARGGEDARETRKNKTRQKGLVQSPRLGSVLWFTGLEQTHPGSSAGGKPQGPTGVGVGGSGSPEAAAMEGGCGRGVR